MYQFKKKKSDWIKHFLKRTKISYPSEGVIRIFQGKYPKLKKPFYKKNDKILDIGHGDGRHFEFFNNIGLKNYGIEISDKINKKTKKFLKGRLKKNLILKKGFSDEIPFKEKTFDILLLWNSCYYMRDFSNPNFTNHLNEYARVLKKNAHIIVSIPMADCFCYKKIIKFKKNYVIIKKDYFNVINGQVMRYFKNEKEIKKVFRSKFKNFIFSEINQKWFGLDYKWHIFIAQKK